MDPEQAELRAYLSEKGAEHFDDIALLRKLGTVNNIHAIGSIYADLAEHAGKNDVKTSSELINRVKLLTDYFARTRGRHSCSVVAAMQIMTKGLTLYRDKPLGETSAFLLDAYPKYQRLSEAWMTDIKTYLGNVIKDDESVLLFDYSSSVAAILEVAAAQGKRLDVYIPCSGVLYGGRQFVIDAVVHGHRPFVVQDVAMYDFIRKADAVFIGAETIYPDGGAANSIGSDILAALCKTCATPLYVVTTMLKYNPAYLQGRQREHGYWDLRERMPIDLPRDVRDAAEFVSINLTQIEPELITAFITNLGVIPPSALYYVGNTYLKSWEESE